MSLKVRKFPSTDELEFFLLGGTRCPSLELYPGIVGLTLIFTAPAAATVTFVAGTDVVQTDPNGLSYAEVKAQIEAAIAGLQVGRVGRELRLTLTSPSPGDGIVITGGTALSLFGLSSVSTKVYNAPGGGIPKLVQAYMGLDNFHTVITEE